MQWGILFPGQGAQYVGMGRKFYESFESSRSTFETADRALGFSISEIVFSGPEERLRDTEIQQPAILAVSMAIWNALKESRPDFSPAVAMGLSLGEYSAYVAAGMMAFDDGVRVTRLRGQAMQDAVPRGLGGMVAILGLKTEVVEELCREVQPFGKVEPANYNAPGQTVVSGLVTGLRRIEDLAQERGARTVRLSVSAPFHSSFLVAAGTVLSKALSGVKLKRASFPVLANIDTEPCTTPEQAVPRLIQQVSHPVRFEQSVRRALADGVEGFIEIGPGKSLTSLVKKIERKVTVVNVDDPESLAKALELL